MAGNTTLEGQQSLTPQDSRQHLPGQGGATGKRPCPSSATQGSTRPKPTQGQETRSRWRRAQHSLETGRAQARTDPPNRPNRNTQAPEQNPAASTYPRDAPHRCMGGGGGGLDGGGEDSRDEWRRSVDRRSCRGRDDRTTRTANPGVASRPARGRRATKQKSSEHRAATRTGSAD